jgi:protein-S-isoprenylcysteine O-methyltransferase Ste14
MLYQKILYLQKKMALYQSITENGQKLFRHRSFIPLILYPLAIITIFIEKDSILSTYELPFSLICIAISLLGLIIRALVIGYVPEDTSGRNRYKQKAETLNTTGIYSAVRHPLYLGNFFMWLGIIIFVGHIWFALVCVLLFWIYYERIMLTEEKFLIEKFGDRYHDWAQQTPAFIPNFSNWKKPSLSFYLKKVIKREHRGLVAVLISMGAIHLIKNYALYEKFKMDQFWLITTIAALCLFIFLRILIKTTNLFRTPRRAW